MPAKEPKQAKEIKPSMTGYITDSLMLLAQQPLPDDDAIHDIRVMMKKHRATLRLARPLLDEAVYNREYLAGRETGRILSSWRETAVLRKTARALRKDNPVLFLKLWDNEQIQSILRKRYSSWEEAGVQARAVSEVKDQLNRTKHRLRFISLKEPDYRMLLEELERSYVAAAGAYLKCRNNPRPNLLHEFRKKSKTFMYQIVYFRHLNPPALKSIEKKLDAMTQNLGRCNDLAQIMAMTGYRYGSAGNSDVADELAIVIRDRQDGYLMKVWPVAYRLFAPGKKLEDHLGITFR
ncbi:MAG: CHAD domain-containing protein [Bacteroidales bacterium]|nr:CHAD domain-containing protein [Bacteroidales bacterium]